MPFAPDGIAYKHSLDVYSVRCGSVHAITWHAAINLDVLSHVAAVIDDLQRTFPNGYGCLVVPRPRKPVPPDESARKEAVRILRSASAMRGLAIVLDAQGFAGAALRMVTSSVLLAARLEAPTRVVATPDDAVEWLVPHLGTLSVGIHTLKSSLHGLPFPTDP